MLGLLAGVLVDGLLILSLIVFKGDLKLPPSAETAFMLLLASVPIVCLWAVYHRLRGGRLVLTAWGVELRHRTTVVRCPWALFSAAGQPFQLKDQVLLPVWQKARPFVEVYRNGILQGAAPVNTRQLRFKASGEAVLSPLYEVSLLELAGFLLELGRTLAAPLPDFSPVAPAATDREEAAAQPAAAVEDGGWIMVRLTRLVFPPFCCNCGIETDEVQEVRGYSRVLSIGKLFRIDGVEHACLAVPVCRDCRRESQTRHFRAVQRVALIGFLVAVLIGLGIALWFRDPAAIACFIFPLALLGIGLGIAGKRAQAPVELERYSASRGTIAVRFRWREYGERLVKFLETQETLA
jgi:hypothetical protein